MAAALDGDIDAESTPGRGSAFTLTIPTGPLLGTKMRTYSEATFVGDETNRPKLPRLSGRILLAEDGIDNRALLTRYLQKAGATVISAENGQIACEKIAKAMSNPADPQFDLVLMDMQMPVMDGYTATATLRERGYAGPIIALTANAMATDREKCLLAGCTDYVSKPVNRLKLLEIVRHHMESSSMPLPGAADPADAAKRAVLDTTEDDPDMLPLLPAFVAHLPGQVKRLLRAMKDENLPEVKEIVHQLKGTGGLYGFMSISQHAARAQEMIESGDAMQSIARHVGVLIDLVRSVRGYQPVSESDPVTTPCASPTQAGQS
jgi:CheY-like chemotaxis protein